MEYVLVIFGGFLVGTAASDLWSNGFSADKVFAGALGFLLATYAVGMVP